MGFHHPIVIEEKMDFDKMDDLVYKLRSGCMETRDFMIEGFVPLALSIVAQYLEECPNLRNESDDMSSEAFLVVVKAIDAIMKSGVPETDNAVGYVSTAVLNRLRTPLRIGRMMTSSLGLAIDTLYETSEAGEIMEEILHVCKTDRQRKIVELRALGHNDDTIADHLGIDASRVYADRKAIEERYIHAQ